MKSIVLYYTLGGSSKKEAERIAEQIGADLCCVKEKRKRGIVSAFMPGSIWAMKRKASDIEPLGIDLNEYEKIVIVCPIWANFPAPAFNAVVGILPQGKQVELNLCSGGGSSEKSKQGTIELIEKALCIVVSYRDIKTDKSAKK